MFETTEPVSPIQWFAFSVRQAVSFSITLLTWALMGHWWRMIWEAHQAETKAVSDLPDSRPAGHAQSPRTPTGGLVTATGRSGHCFQLFLSRGGSAVGNRSSHHHGFCSALPCCWWGT